MLGYYRILEHELERRVKEDMKAYFDCLVFPDTRCFFCGLCDCARQEKENYEEYKKMPKRWFQGE
jgi:hypothetical protein